MRRGTPDHPKVWALMRAAELSRPAVVGTLEMLWHFTAKYAPQGDVGKWPDERIAWACGWDGDAATFITLLVDTQWLDRDTQHRLLVHDWAIHCDGSVRKHLKDHALSFAKVATQSRTGERLSRAPKGKERKGVLDPASASSQGRESERGEGSDSGGVVGRHPEVRPVAAEKPPAVPLGTSAFDSQPATSPDTMPEALATWARGEGCKNPQRAWEQCRDWFESKGKVIRRWPQAYRNWIRKAHGGQGPPCVCAERAEVQCTRCQSFGHRATQCDKTTGAPRLEAIPDAERQQNAGRLTALVAAAGVRGVS